MPGTRSIKKEYELNSYNAFHTLNHSLNIITKIDRRKIIGS